MLHVTLVSTPIEKFRDKSDKTCKRLIHGKLQSIDDFN